MAFRKGNGRGVTATLNLFGVSSIRHVSTGRFWKSVDVPADVLSLRDSCLLKRGPRMASALRAPSVSLLRAPFFFRRKGEDDARPAISDVLSGALGEAAPDLHRFEHERHLADISPERPSPNSDWIAPRRARLFRTRQLNAPLPPPGKFKSWSRHLRCLCR